MGGGGGGGQWIRRTGPEYRAAAILGYDDSPPNVRPSLDTKNKSSARSLDRVHMKRRIN
eukprot:SAG31_NODE_2609_length_5382_cov_6.846678_2_plen_59_part_00